MYCAVPISYEEAWGIASSKLENVYGHYSMYDIS